MNTAPIPCACMRCSSATLRRLLRGVRSPSRAAAVFLERVWALADKVQDGDTYSEQHEVLMNRTIKKVGADADNLKANTAIAALMTMLNEFYDKGVNRAEYKTFLALLNPFAPAYHRGAVAAVSARPVCSP